MFLLPLSHKVNHFMQQLGQRPVAVARAVGCESHMFYAIDRSLARFGPPALCVLRAKMRPLAGGLRSAITVPAGVTAAGRRSATAYPVRSGATPRHLIACMLALLPWISALGRWGGGVTWWSMADRTASSDALTGLPLRQAAWASAQGHGKVAFMQPEAALDFDGPFGPLPGG